MNKKRIGITAAFILISFLSASAGLAAPAVILKDDVKKVILGTRVDILKDETGKLTIDDVSSGKGKAGFTQSTEEIPNYGFDGHNYWMRLRLRNDTGHDAQWFLELGYSHANILKVYTQNAEGRFTAREYGDVYRFDRRDIKYRNIVSVMDIKAGEEREYYLLFAGDCSKQFPLVLWSPAAFAEMALGEKFILGIYYGIIIVMMAYNLFLFFFVRDRSYLFYVIYIASYGMVQMAYNGMAFEYLWPGLPAWHNISLPFLIGNAVFWMALFSKNFLHSRDHSALMDRIITAVAILSGGMMVFSVAGNYLAAIRAAMLLMVFASGVIVAAGAVVLRKGYRPARFFLISWAAFLAGMMLIALNKLSVVPSVFITEYAIQIGSALEVTLLSVALADRINVINEEKRIAQLGEMKAQEKYKLLVEGSKEIIFTLDDRWNFLSANRAMRDHLSVDPVEVTSMNFLDLVFERHGEEHVSRHIVEEHLKNFAIGRKPVTFNAEFKSPISTEPKELKVRLEYVSIDGKDEVLGKASTIEEDALLRYFNCEKQRFSIGNYFLTAEDVTQRITRNLSKFMEIRQINLIRVALREIIINAIEHGNLNITYEEKTDAQMSNSYFTFIAERRQRPEYRDRKVHIEYLINAEKAAFKITDEGNGFDHDSVLQKSTVSANEQMLAHGRGLAMATNIFDSIEFNDRGNQVLLVKYIQ